MKKQRVYRVLGLLTATALLWTAAPVVLAEPPASSQDSSAAPLQAGALTADTSYHAYGARHAGAARPEDPITLDAAAGIRADARLSADPLGSVDPVLETGEESVVQWEFHVPQAGLYHLAVEYYTGGGKGLDMERSIAVNGDVPFDELRSVAFSRAWTDGDIPVDENGNEYRPVQAQAERRVRATLCADDLSPYAVYLQAGTNSVTLTALKDDMTVYSLLFFQEEEPVSYADYQQAHAQYADLPAKGIEIQAERPALKSHSYLYAQNDRTSPATYPSDVVKVKMNTIGGSNWRQPRQWITWDFHVKQAGLYTLSMRVKQNFTEGSYSSRRVTIDGGLPFQELAAVGFTYSTRWRMVTLGGDEPYLIYLEPGDHTLTMENTVGALAGVVAMAEESLTELNALYRKILMLTGNTADANRNYKIFDTLPESREVLERNADILARTKADLLAVTGSKGQSYAAIERLEVQLRGFLKAPNTIPVRLDTFRINISSLSSWLLTAKEQPLLLDALWLLPAGEDTPRAESPWYSRAWYEIQCFFASFFTDYNSVGSLDGGREATETITLWLGSGGRDQSKAVKTLTDNLFTPTSGIRVDIKLVDMGILLPAVVTGNGPDIAIGQDRSMPLNYAFRGALLDLAALPGCDEVMERFSPEAATAFRYKDRLYALPETFAYSMLFYRRDILEELDLEVPQLWTDLYDIIPALSNAYLDVGFPSVTDDNLELFLALLYQQGGQVYDDGLTKTALAGESSIRAFETWSNFYTKYKVPQKLDQLTRFRTGETPVVIAPYTFYNSLAAAAPEINGLWDFTLVPGTRDEATGEVNRDVYGTGTGAIIFANTGRPEASWEFLKWWTAAEAQAAYNDEMESLLGPSGRVATANLEALERLPWSTGARKAILDQMATARGLPEAPGGYLTARYVGTAVRLVINSGLAPREAIMDWSTMIDDEIADKNKEFGLLPDAA